MCSFCPGLLSHLLLLGASLTFREEAQMAAGPTEPCKRGCLSLPVVPGSQLTPTQAENPPDQLTEL